METREIIKYLSLITLILLPFIVYGILLPLRQKSGFMSVSRSSGGMLLSKVPDVCSDLGNRTDCLTAKGCGWCESAGMCMKAHHANQCESGMVMPSKIISGFAVPTPPDCDQYKNCATCANAPSCGWCRTDNKCKESDRLGASGGTCRPEGSFITSSGTCDSRINLVGGGNPVSNELLGDSPANSVSLGSRNPTPASAQPPSGADIQVAASPEPTRRNMPATGAINAPGSGAVAAATPACLTTVSFKLSELPIIEAKLKNDILKVLQVTRTT